jgi:hypothetical protein
VQGTLELSDTVGNRPLLDLVELNYKNLAGGFRPTSIKYQLISSSTLKQNPVQMSLHERTPRCCRYFAFLSAILLCCGTTSSTLARKSEVHTFTALVLCGLDIVFSLFRSPRVPNFVSPAVHPFIIKIHCNIEANVTDRYPNQFRISPAIPRGVI